jgi:fibronectin-binding autotransporter adhesin
LHLDGDDAFVEDSGAQGSNSALTGLALIGAGAAIILFNGSSVSTSRALVNNGIVATDNGSSMSVGGKLTNSGSLNIGDSGSAKLTAETLSNSGNIQLVGSSETHQALLDVTTGLAGFGSAGTVTGSVAVLDHSAIEFLSGQITTIAASSELLLRANSAFVEDSTALGSNSALSGLADVSGSLYLQGDTNGGASVSTTVALTNTGFIDLQVGGDTLSIGGALTNSGTLDVSGSSVTAKGAVGGAGSFSLNGANLQFDSSVSAGQTITETGADALILEQAQNFAATIKGFGTGDTIDATNFLKTATTYNFVENLMGTGGTLTLTDTSHSPTANIPMTGDYSKSSFTLASDSGTGTLVRFV